LTAGFGFVGRVAGRGAACFVGDPDPPLVARSTPAAIAAAVIAAAIATRIPFDRRTRR
jgi:hypothetical protein